MAQLNLTKLASQGRAFSALRPWKAEELDALLAIEKECEVQRVRAAELVRNGVNTVEAAKKAIEAGFQPKSLETLQNEAVIANRKEVRKELGLPDEDEPEPEAEEQPEVALEAEEVTEPEAEEAKPKKKATKK